MLHQFLTAQEAQIAVNSSRNCRMESQNILIWEGPFRIIDPSSWPCTETNPTSAFLVFPGHTELTQTQRASDKPGQEGSQGAPTAPAAPQPFSQSGMVPLEPHPSSWFHSQANSFLDKPIISGFPRECGAIPEHPSHPTTLPTKACSCN